MSRTSPPSDRVVGHALGSYCVVQLLGSGGMADVYLAERGGEGGVRVALKVLKAEHRASRALVARFEREATAASRVHHANVLAASDLELLEDGTRLFATELLVGLDLADTLHSAGSLSAPRAVRVGIGLADGLGAAHALGIVHRDVKPENVFLVHAPDGREIVKLLDFGFAHLGPGHAGAPPSERITERLTVVGTPEYMAPEQAFGVDAAPTADVYSTGVVLFEMLAGRIPFVGASYPELAHQHAESPLPALRSLRPGLVVSRELEALVVRSLAKAAAERFSTGDELARALRATPEAGR